MAWPCALCRVCVCVSTFMCVCWCILSLDLCSPSVTIKTTGPQFVASAFPTDKYPQHDAMKLIRGLSPPPPPVVSPPPHLIALFFLYSHFLLNTCSSQKSLQLPFFCPPRYISCLHEIGCSVWVFFGLVFSQCHIGRSGENYSWQLFYSFLNVFNVQLRYLYFCNIKCFFLSLLS